MTAMSPDRHLIAAGIVAAAFVLTFLYYKYQVAPATKNGIPLPPGPPARWFWESAFPRSNISHTLGGWVARYGPVISLREGSRVTIVVGRLDAAAEIMEKEGAALADRPRSVAYGEIMSNNMNLVVTGSGERFPCEDVILDILRDPKHHVEHVKRFTISVILRVVYGKSTPTSNDDPEVHSEPVLRRPGGNLVDIFPILKYVPGYVRDLRKYHEFELSLYRDQLGRVKAEMERSGSFVQQDALENAGDNRLSYDEMAYLAELYSATYVAIATCSLAAACHPQAQARVQEELDTVVGMDQAPTFEDSNRLPQLHAFMSEALRWRPVVSTGITHRATEDIIWRGHIIPAGATVLGCHWAISRDPIAYPNPEKFDPQRWLDPNGQLRTDLWFCTYGFGRRVCPALHLANRSIYISRPDAQIDVDSFTDSLVSRPGAV
ncbi:cytochrome P450 [Melanogaster broomeanus]|nr:cytochrome P450 [Melanogaster broomeanus]